MTAVGSHPRLLHVILEPTFRHPELSSSVILNLVKDLAKRERCGSLRLPRFFTIVQNDEHFCNFFNGFTMLRKRVFCHETSIANMLVGENGSAF